MNIIIGKAKKLAENQNLEVKMETFLRFLQADKNLSQNFKKTIKENQKWKNKEKQQKL